MDHKAKNRPVLVKLRNFREEEDYPREEPVIGTTESNVVIRSVDDYVKELTDDRQTKQLEHYLKVDLEAGKRCPPKSWNDLDSSFVYTMDDIPQPYFEPFSFVKLKVAQFKALDNWTAVLYDKHWREIRRRLNSGIREYCHTVCCDPEWVPEKGQIIFVQIPEQAEMDNLRILELGLLGRLNWYDHPDNIPDHQNPKEQDRYAGLWARAVFLGKTSKDPLAMPLHKSKSLQTSYGFNVHLIDFGRDVTVHRYYARRAVWRFMPYPVIAPNFVLMIHGAKYCSPALHAKWKKILRTDTTLVVRVMVNLAMDNQLMVDLVSPSENQFEEMYKKMLKGKVDQSLLPVAKPHWVETDMASHVVQVFRTLPVPE